jgi:stage V sporulation protein R
VRNHLTRDLASSMGLFRYQRQENGQIKVEEDNIDALHENLLLDKYNFGAPRISVSEVRQDGTLVLTHDNSIDGRGIDPDRGRKVLEYVHRVWRRPVLLKTVDERSEPLELTATGAGSA